MTMPNQENSRSRRRVLIISPQPFFMQRGTPLNVRATAVALVKGGYDVDILAFPFGEPVDIPGVRVHRTFRPPGIKSVPIGPSWRKVLLDLFLSLSAFKLVATRRYDTLQGIEEGGVIALILGKLFRLPSIFDMDSCMVSQLQASGFLRSGILLRLVSAIENLCIRHSSAIVTVCKALTDKAQSVAPGRRIHQIEDFPMEEVDQVDAESLALARRFLRVGHPTILYTGNFETYQGLELLLAGFRHAFESADFSTMSPTLLLVGGDERAISQLRLRAQSLGISHLVVFAGQRPGKEMGAFMHCADVLVSPRLLGNNTPLKLYSYMASGKPIVATNIESHTQVLDEESAYLADPTPAALGQALLACLDSSPAAADIRRQRAAHARQLVETRYSRKRFEDQFNALYSELLDSPIAEAAGA